ncbi:MAG: hypothetical protein ACTSPX_00050 [Candidatus Thorarchaeota archaeon]
MTYSVLTLIELMGAHFPVLLHAVLNRFPIIVVGEDTEIVDDLVSSIAMLAPHHHTLVFWRDFTSEDEITAVWEEERHDYEVARTTVCCLSSNIRLALDRVRSFNGWIIGVTVGKRALGLEVDESVIEKLRDLLTDQSRNHGVLRVKSPSDLVFHTACPPAGKLQVERHIVNKILTRKKQSLERIRRLLKKSVRGMEVPTAIVQALLQLDEEAVKVTHDMFNEEVSGFVHAARRAVTILSRIRLVREVGAPTRLTERNLFEAIGWSIGGVSDMIRFIQAEWHEDFSDCVNSSALMGLGAWVDSMWGA